MTNREKEILDILRSDPMISQSDLASRLGITRSSIAVHISNLFKKGLLVGKGYILNEKPYVLVIGGSNIDIQGVPKNKLIPKDSNMGEVNISLGGVGRNIAENLARLGVETKLISVIGNDPYGQNMVDHSNSIGLNMSECLFLKDQGSSIYLSILDEEKDMLVAINAMDSIQALDKAFIQSKKAIIERAVLIVLDTNLSEEVIIEICAMAKAPIFVDPVSSTKALKLKPVLSKIHTLKPNRLEAEVLSGQTLHGTQDYPMVTQTLHQLGVQNVMMSLGSEGIFSSTPTQTHFEPNPKVHVLNATGAGDAFMAALVLAYLKEMDLKSTLQLALCASALAIDVKSTIHPDLSEDLLLKKRKELYP